MSKKSLTNIHEITIRFSEVDSMGVVWHGNYVKYLEDGREAFGNQFGLNYLDVYKHGYLTPVVKLECNYKMSLIYGDTAIIETRFQDCEAAKIIFDYIVFKKPNKEIIFTAQSTQVFLDKNRELCLTYPDFYKKWKQNHGLIIL